MNTRIDHLVLSAAAATAIAFASSFFYFNPKLEQLEEEIALRPPVIVVDMTKLAIDSVPIGSSKEDIEAHFEKAQKIIDQFKKAGFLVLPRENIISAPDDLMLTQTDLNTTDSKDETGE